MTPYIIVQSKAIFGTWFYFPRYNVMFDCGESACYTLGIHTSDIKYIFISHFHKDHYIGLIGIGCFLSRVTRKNSRKVKVFYHRNNEYEIKNIEFALKSLDIKNVFDFIPFNFNEKIEIDGKKFVEPFEVDHTAKYYKKGLTACGFRLLEYRKSLKSVYKNKIDKLTSNNARAEFINKLKNNNIDIYNINDYTFITYCGDSLPIDFKKLKDTEILMHECTFLTKKELDAAHTDLESLSKAIKNNKANIGKIIIYHLSEKYIRQEKEYKDLILEELKNFNVDVVEINRLYKSFI